MLRRELRTWARRVLATLALGAFVAGLVYLVHSALETAAESERGESPRSGTVPVGPPVRTAPDRRTRGSATPRIAWRASRSFGVPWAGWLERGVQLPAEGRRFFTWDPVRRRSPNRDWRRWGSARLVRLLLRVLANVGAPQRIGVGDLSRPRGGDFGPRYGLPGHVSHQNGLDADVYLPRRDGRERPPDHPREIARRLAQRLVDEFVRAGAAKVFVGPRTDLRGPPAVVQVLPHHDNHLHVRIP